MKRNIITCAYLLLGVLLLAILPTEVEGAVYTDTVRLHIPAHSDSEADQAVKLAVRDAILCEYADALSASSPEQAEKKICEQLPEIEALAERVLREHGMPYGATATLTREWYDTREYADFSMPKGYYTSLVVTLGEGEGHNWWCVMYPPLCLNLATDAPREDGVLGTLGGGVLEGEGRYRVKFKTLELFSALTKTKKD